VWLTATSHQSPQKRQRYQCETVEWERKKGYHGPCLQDGKEQTSLKLRAAITSGLAGRLGVSCTSVFLPVHCQAPASQESRINIRRDRRKSCPDPAGSRP
jgi:hypothetical protein